MAEQQQLGPNLTAFVGAGILDDEKARALPQTQKDEIESLSDDVVQLMISVHQQVGPVEGSFLI